MLTRLLKVKAQMVSKQYLSSRSTNSKFISKRVFEAVTANIRGLNFPEKMLCTSFQLHVPKIEEV